MPDLVETVLLGLAKPARLVKRVVFEEKPDLVAGLLEVPVGLVLVAAGREHGADRPGVEGIDEFECALPQCGTSLSRDKIA